MSIKPKNSRGTGRTGMFPMNREDLRARVGGVNPSTLQPDEEDRFELFEKIRKFYVLYTDGNRLKDGLGEIVEWGLSNGEYELNQRLKKHYKGFDLESTLEHSQEERKVLFRRPNLNNKRHKTLTKRGAKGSYQTMSVKTLKHHQSTENGGKYLTSGVNLPSEEAIRDKLRDFYRIHDPGMLNNNDSFNRVLLYALQKGIQKLNLKLQKKFKTTDGLYFNEEESEIDDTSRADLKGSLTASITSKKNQSFTTLLRSAEQERAEKNKPRTRTKTNTSHAFTLNIQNPAGMLSVAGSRRIQPSIARDFENKTRLPPQLKLFLKMYYSCYDPVYIVRDKLTGAKLYAEEVGMEKFDVSLQTKYKESLTDFQGRVELLQDKLQNFYLTVDLRRTNDALMGVLQWTLRNGMTCLNRELRGRYGVDLQNYNKPQGTIEPEPISTPEVEPRF